MAETGGTGAGPCGNSCGAVHSGRFAGVGALFSESRLSLKINGCANWRHCAESLRVPRHLQAVCAIHLLTGIILLICSRSRGGSGPALGGVLLCLSCLIVLILCRYTTGAMRLNIPKKAGVKQDLEAPLPHSEIRQDKICCEDIQVRGSAEVHVAKAEPQADAVSDVAPETCDKSFKSEGDTERAVQEAGTVADTQIPSLCLTVHEEASIHDGLRCLMAHHLRREGVTGLSESQAGLLEHHLVRLASYCEKIVHTISFAQRIYTEDDASCTVRAQPDADLEAACVGHAEESAAPKRPKKLRLHDEELLAIYSSAQQEAELEADWRGIHLSARGRERIPPLILPLASGAATKGGMPLPLPLRESSERKEAIGLLGQALAARDAPTSDDLAAASKELASRLIPVRQPRPCADVLERADYAAACCLPSQGRNEDAGRQGAENDFDEAAWHFRVPPERDDPPHWVMQGRFPSSESPSQAPLVQRGTILLCRETAIVFESTIASVHIGQIQIGSFIVAAGPPVASRASVMVPIEPFGAVQLQRFEVREARSFQN